MKDRNEGETPQTPTEPEIIRLPWRYECPACGFSQVRRIRKNREKWFCNKCRECFESPIDKTLNKKEER